MSSHAMRMKKVGARYLISNSALWSLSCTMLWVAVVWNSLEDMMLLTHRRKMEILHTQGVVISIVVVQPSDFTAIDMKMQLERCACAWSSSSHTVQCRSFLNTAVSNVRAIHTKTQRNVTGQAMRPTKCSQMTDSMSAVLPSSSMASISAPLLISGFSIFKRAKGKRKKEWPREINELTNGWR